MNILCSELFESQLKSILKKYADEDLEATKKFKLYLDTIIINMPTKVEKYKQSTLFDDESIKEIPHEGLTITFHIDTTNNCYLLLGIHQANKT